MAPPIGRSMVRSIMERQPAYPVLWYCPEDGGLLHGTFGSWASRPSLPRFRDGKAPRRGAPMGSLRSRNWSNDDHRSSRGTH